MEDNSSIKSSSRTLKRVGHSFLELGLGQAIASLSGFFLTLGLVHFLPPHSYGLYSYLLSAIAVISLFGYSGLNTMVAQETARGELGSFKEAFPIKFLWSLPASLITLLGALYYFFNGNPIMGGAFLVATFTIPVVSASSLYVSFLNGTKEYRKVAIDNALRNLVICASVLLCAYFTRSVFGCVLAFYGSTALYQTIRYLMISRHAPSSTSIKKDKFGFASHLSFMEIAMNIGTQIDKILIFHFLGAVSLAFYSLALAPISQLQGVTKIMSTLTLPPFSTTSFSHLKKRLVGFIVLSFIGSMILSLLYSLFARYFFITFFPTYETSIFYSQLLSLGLVVIPATIPLQALMSHQKTKELYIIQASKPFMKILLCVCLIPFFGILGAILAYVIASFLYFFIATLLFFRAT